MRVEVVLDNGHARTARGANGLPDFFNLLVAAWPTVNGVGESTDHHVPQGEPTGFEVIHDGADAAFFPGNARASHEDMIDAELLDAAHAGGSEAPG